MYFRSAALPEESKCTRVQLGIKTICIQCILKTWEAQVYLNKPRESHDSYFVSQRVQMWISADKDLLFLGSGLCKLPEAREEQVLQTFCEGGGWRSILKLDTTLGKVKTIQKLSACRSWICKRSEVCPLVIPLLCTSRSIRLWHEEAVSSCSLRKSMCEAVRVSRLKGHWVWGHKLFKVFFFILLVLFKWLWATYWTKITHTCVLVLLLSWIPQNPLNDVWKRPKSPGPGILTCDNNIGPAAPICYLTQQQSFTHSRHLCSLHVS